MGNQDYSASPNTVEGFTRPGDFDDLADNVAIRSVRFRLLPENWAQYRETTELVWEVIKFDRPTIMGARQELAGRRGVYTLVIQSRVANHPHGDYLVYVGKTEDQDFYTRWLQELNLPNLTSPKQPRLRRYLVTWGDHMWAFFAEMDDSIHEVEQGLQAVWLPPANDKLPGIWGQVTGALG